MLFAAQTDITGDLTGKEALKRFDKAPDVSRMGMFTNHPDDIGASIRVLEDVTTMVEYCAAYGMGHITMEQKFHLFIASAFAKELRKLWQASYRAAPASTTGIGQGSKIYVAFLNFVAAYSTTSDKCKALQMADSTPTRASFTTHGRTLGLARSSAGAKAARLTRFVDRMYVCARACPFGVYLAFHL